MLSMFQQARCDRATFLNIIKGIGIIFGIAVAAAVVEGICLGIGVLAAAGANSCEKYCPPSNNGGGPVKRDDSTGTFTPFPTTQKPHCAGGNNTFEAACKRAENLAFSLGLYIGIAIIVIGLVITAGIAISCLRNKAKTDARNDAVRLDNVTSEDARLLQNNRT